MDLFLAKRVAGIITFFTALIGVVIGLVIFVLKEDERTAKRYLKYIERGEFSAITDLIDAGDFNGRLLTVEHLKSAFRQGDQQFVRRLITNWHYAKDIDGEFYDLLNRSPFETRLHFVKTMDGDSVKNHFIPERISFLRSIQYVNRVDTVTQSIGLNSRGQIGYEYSTYNSGDDGLIYERQSLTDMELPYDRSAESLVEEAKELQVKKFGIKPVIKYDEVDDYIYFLEYALRMRDDSLALALMEEYDGSDFYRFDDLFTGQSEEISDLYFSKRTHFRHRVPREKYADVMRKALLRNSAVDAKHLPQSRKERQELLYLAIREKAFTTFESIVTAVGTPQLQVDSLLLTLMPYTSPKILRYCVTREDIYDTLPQWPEYSVGDVLEEWLEDHDLLAACDGIKNGWPDFFYDVALNSSFSCPPKSLEVTDSLGRNALHIAARYNGERMIEKVLAVTPNLLDRRDRNGRMPIYYAAQAGNINTVDNLISRGCFVSDTLHKSMDDAVIHGYMSMEDYEVEEYRLKLREITRMIYHNRTSLKAS